MRSRYTTPSAGQIALADLLELPEVVLQIRLHRSGKHGDSVLRALPVTHQDLVGGKIDVLDTEAESLHQPQPCAVHEHAHEPMVPLEAAEYRPGLVPCHHHRQPLRSPCPNDIPEISDLTAKDLPIEKQKRRKGLVLRRGADVLLYRKVCEKGVDLRLRHFGWMADMVYLLSKGEAGLSRSSREVRRRAARATGD
jgi:hypothetical protein